MVEVIFYLEKLVQILSPYSRNNFFKKTPYCDNATASTVFSNTRSYLQAHLYRAGRFNSALRLLHAQVPMEDDRKLCEYSLPEGTTISALFEPDVDINIEVSTCHQTQKLTVSNTTTVLALKVQICDIMKCGVEPEKLEIRLGDVTLEDPMPLHFYGVKNGSQLEAVKPYINVMVMNTEGNGLYWHLNRKDTIRDVKIKLPIRLRSGEYPNDSAKVEQMRLFLVTDGQNFDELDNNKTVENHKIKEDSRLYLLSYMWTQKFIVTLKRTGTQLWGLEKDDTCLGVKVKAQDQVGSLVSSIKLARLVEYKWRKCVLLSFEWHTHVQKYNKLKEISDEQFPFNYKEPLYVITEEELQADASRVEAEREAGLEKLRNQGYDFE